MKIAEKSRQKTGKQNDVNEKIYGYLQSGY
jgi:hypothetical protein